MQHASSLLVIHTLNCHWTLAFIASMAPFILSCIGVVIVMAEKEKRWIKKLNWFFEFHSQQRQKWTKGCILDFCKMRNDSNFFTMQLHFFCSSYLQRVAQCRRVFLVCDCVHLTSVPKWAHPVINHISWTSLHLFVSQTLRLSLSHCVQSVSDVFVFNIPDMYSEELQWREEEAKRQGGGERRESGWKDRDGGREGGMRRKPASRRCSLEYLLHWNCNVKASVTVIVCVCVCCLCVRGD